MDKATETLITFGDAIKAADDGSYGGYLVLFSGPEDPDLTGEFFTKDTDFDFEDGDRTTVYYHHGQDGTLKRTRLGQGVLRRDEQGVRIEEWKLKIDARTWASAQAAEREEYEQYIKEMIEAGRLGWSSGTAAHLVEYEQAGKASWIKRWPLRLDASITPTPAEPRTRVVPLKAYLANLEAADKGVGKGADGAPTQDDAGRQADQSNEETDMDENKVMEMALKAVRDELAARDAQTEAERKEQARIEEAVKAATDAVKSEYEKKLAEDRRVPGGAPIVLSMPGRKFDYLSPTEHALALAIQDAAYKSGRRGATPITDDALRALALKAESERNKGYSAGDYALKALAMRGGPVAIKSDEIMHSDLTSYGLEWVEHMYSTDLWEKIRAERWVLQQLEARGDSGEIPDGFDGVNIKLESTDPTWYKVAEAADLNATTGRPDATINASRFVTGEKLLTVAKGGARIVFSGELSEDSIIRIAPQATRQLRESAGETLEQVVIDGDTATGASTNINDIADTPGGTEAWLLANGFRKLALVTNTANSRDAGALTEDDYLETVKLMGTAGINADLMAVSFIVDMNTYWKTLQLATLKTRDVWQQATLETGQVVNMWGYPLRPSAFMHKAQASRLANSAGKLDLDTAGNNTTGAILAVRWDQWAWRWKRRMTVEMSRFPEADANQIVMMMRFGLAYRDTEASAISYNVTV